MRYFTRELFEGELDDAEEDALRAAYEARAAAIESRLPLDVVRLLKDVVLHDGLIEWVSWSPRRERLSLGLVVGDLQSGYRALTLVYGGAQLGAHPLDALRRAAESRHTEILADEVDVGEDGLFAHRILFWPSEQVTLEFASLSLDSEPRPDRRVHLLSPFQVEDEDDDAQ